MKQQTNHQPKVKNQTWSRNDESIFCANETTIHLQPRASKSNTILVQNIGKDPPGRCRSPEEACRLNPDNRPVSIKSNKTLFNIDSQLFKQIQNPNFFYN